MKRMIHFPRILGALLAALLVLASCHDDDSSVMDSAGMLNQTLVPTTYSFMWNGSLKEQRNDVSAVFRAIDGKADQAQMTISGIIPSADEDQTLQVSVSPQTDEVLYVGQFTDPRYELAVNGSWFPYTNGNYFKMKCTYKVLGGVVFDVASELVPSQGNNGSHKLLLTFKNDGTVVVDDAYVVDGKSTAVTLMTVNYWFSKEVNKVILEFNEAQVSTLNEKWKELTGDEEITGHVVKYKETGRYALYLNVTETENNNNLITL